MFETETLEQALGRVRAPRELWSRVEGAGVPRPAHRLRKLAWSVAAAAAFAGVAWNLPRPEFQSNDPAAIRAWVQQHAGFDLPLAHSGPARVESVRLKRNGVEVAYRAGAKTSALSVSKATAGEKAHWSANGQSFVVACATPAELDASCGLCHI
jgi:hypothetical protein